MTDGPVQLIKGDCNNAGSSSSDSVGGSHYWPDGTYTPDPVSYRSMVPKREECINLIVPGCLSYSHVAYGSIRMEPVFMILGQSAGTAASLAIKGKVNVQDIDYPELRKCLISGKQVL